MGRSGGSPGGREPFMKITGIKTAFIGEKLFLRVMTDKGIDGYGQTENNWEHVRQIVPYFESLVVGVDPTDVAAVMRRLRRVGAFKPWGKITSSIEMAVWDIAGKDAGLPVYKLLGGKLRDRVRIYNGCFQHPNPPHKVADTPEKIAENMLAINELVGISIFKLGCGWHGFFHEKVPVEGNAYNAYPVPGDKSPYRLGGPLTEKGLNLYIDHITRIKKVLGDKVGLAIDSGPGMTAIDTLRFCKAMEPFNLLWVEDSIAGDFTPWTLAHVYRDLKMQTTTPIHTGEQLYLRQNCRELIETRAIDVIGPDPLDVGGLAELKWIAEYADLHGIMMAPHGGGDGIFGMAALTHVCATMGDNYIGYEYPYPYGGNEWFYDIVEGLPDPLIQDGHIPVWDRPGLGVEFNINKASKYLSAADKDFFL